MKDNINYEAPEDWGVSPEDTWVSFEELKDNGAPALEGRDVVSFAMGRQVQMPPHDGKPAKLQDKCSTGWNDSDGDGRCEQGTKPSITNRRRPRNQSPASARRSSDDQPSPELERKGDEIIKQLRTEKKNEAQPKPEAKKEKTKEEGSSNLTGIQSGYEQRKKVLENRGVDAGNFFDQFKDNISKRLGGNQKLSEAANKAVDAIGLFLDGNGKRISGDVVKEAPDNPQSEKKFSFEYVIN